MWLSDVDGSVRPPPDAAGDDADARIISEKVMLPADRSAMRLSDADPSWP